MKRLRAEDAEFFMVNGKNAFLMLPANRRSNASTPWVWYAPTLENLPGAQELWMFNQFLESGMAIAGIDIGESFGNPEGKAVYSAFYRELIEKRKLAKQACLLARSRGGLMLYNWAIENPDEVACIAGIYPVVNIESFPGIHLASDAYNLPEEQLIEKLTEHNPIDRLKSLADASVPIFHIHGDKDEAVSVEENSVKLKNRYDELGGESCLEIITDRGHDLWAGWFQNQRLVNFVIQHAAKGGTCLK